jgi:hypothetical protein
MGQAPPTRTVEAQSFVLRDANGNRRAELALFGTKGSILRFFDGDEVAASLTVAGMGSSRLDLASANQGRGLAVGVRRQGPWLDLWDTTGSMVLVPSRVDLVDSGKKAASTLMIDSGGAALKLLDSHGFATVIGNIGLVTPATGESHQTSAASILMFNDKNQVFWTAPPQ